MLKIKFVKVARYMKKKILIYGTSSKALRELTAMLMHYQLVGFVDSTPNLSSPTLLGLPIYHFTDLVSLDFELIIICSSFNKAIEDNLKSVNIHSFVNSNDLSVIQEMTLDIKALSEKTRAEEIQRIPNIPLLASHIDSCKMLPNRTELLKLLPQNGTVVEMGVANGDFSADILTYNRPKCLHLVDIWGSERYSSTLQNKVKNRFANQLEFGNVVINHNFSQDAVGHFPDHYFDWIYIDTTHSYAQTKLELELYAPKVKQGGIIAGHDYLLGNWTKSYKYGVMEAVHEFCVSYGYKFKYLTMDLSENQSFAIQKIT
jgi:hypothetical protein